MKGWHFQNSWQGGDDPTLKTWPLAREDVCEQGCESGDGLLTQQNLATVFILTANADLVQSFLCCQANNAPFHLQWPLSKMKFFQTSYDIVHTLPFLLTEMQSIIFADFVLLLIQIEIISHFSCQWRYKKITLKTSASKSLLLNTI